MRQFCLLCTSISLLLFIVVSFLHLFQNEGPSQLWTALLQFFGWSALTMVLMWVFGIIIASTLKIKRNDDA